MKRPALVALAALLALSGCATSDGLEGKFGQGTDPNYATGDGTILEIPEAQREAPVEFSGETDAATQVSSTDYAGQVLVVNFWYAGCPPCRLEAPDLQALNEEFADQDVKFLGVNVRDQAATSATTTRKWGITYPSIIDANDKSVVLAFAGTVAPNAVPTTLVIDKEGRVAARYLGYIESPSILRTLIKDALAEGTSEGESAADSGGDNATDSTPNPEGD